MKKISELNLPEDIYYSEDHEWVKLEGKVARIGISDYAQDQMGDITFVEVPEVGDTFEEGEQFGSVESTKAVSEMLLPVSGEVVAVNKDLEDSPGLINEDPYGRGWIIEIRPDDADDIDSLLTKEDYLKLLEGTE